MFRARLVPNVVLEQVGPLTSCVGFAGVAGDWQRGEKLLDDMRAARIEPTVITYTTLIHVLGQAGQWQKAQAALLRMQKDGLVPDLTLYNVVSVSEALVETATLCA
jgi:pentatricopeptide repeat protein